MSYDLYFNPRGGVLDDERVAAYFRGRSNYEVDLPEIHYSNADTGVYFHFTLHDAEEQDAELDEDATKYAAMFNINFYRPSYFILEAEPEVTAFVKAFDLTISDPQIDGIGDGEYDPAKLVSGWNTGNEFAYRALLSGEDAPTDVASLPRARLEAIWRWNFERARLQERLGERVFVPLKMLLRVDGSVCAVSAWPDAIPIATTAVDHFVVGREEFAPRKLLFRRKDSTFVAWQTALPWLEKYRSREHPDPFVLDYAETPGDLGKFVESLPVVAPQVEGIPFDQILDREWVDQHWSKRDAG
ncbi:MAG: hypothetical protein H7Y89_01885 [Steroidobacteraceae bacterium]|nr:hypothetical protein [Steroidobacteraceae bacterium]